jgi:Tfp pilus assembly protein FimV
MSELSLGAQEDIDMALRTFLDGYDIAEFLETRDEEYLETGFYIVKQGDTLDGIINKIYPSTAIKKDILREAFVIANPNSFRNRNPNFIFSGKRLLLPNEEDIGKIIFNENVRNLRSDRSTWVRFP